MGLPHWVVIFLMLIVFAAMFGVFEKKGL
jgi:hypothetical protein